MRGSFIMLRALMVLAVLLLSLEGAVALPSIPSDGSPSDSDGPDSRVKRAIELVRGPNSVERKRSASTLLETSTEIGTDILPSTSEETHHEFKLAPMKGFQQLAGSQAMKGMLKNLITANVPVMMQTMMMVENGAATGYLGSLNAVGSLMSNTMQATNLQFDIYDAIEPQGPHKKQFIESAYKSFTKENKGVWPAALFYAMGDKLKLGEEDIEALEEFKQHPREYGSSPEDLPGTKQASGNSGESTSDLVDRLYPESKMSEKTENGQVSLKDVRADVKRWVGSFETTTKSSGPSGTESSGPSGTESSGPSGAAETSRKFIPPEAEVGQLSSPLIPGRYLNVYEVYSIQTRLEVWKNLHEVMKEYCNFKKNNPVESQDIFKKDAPSSAIKDDSWKKIHAEHIKPSINVIDQLFKVAVMRTPVESYDCDSFVGTKNTMPEMGQRGSGSGIQSFDSCEGDKARTCLRNLMMFKVTKAISEDKAADFYQTLGTSAYSQASTPSDKKEVEELFRESLKLEPGMSPGEILDEKIEDNIIDWLEFVTKLSKVAQGMGASSVFRPAENHISGYKPDNVAMAAPAS